MIMGHSAVLIIQLHHMQIDQIRCYEGDKDKLGNAEKFYLLLSQVPAFRLRIEGMLLKVGRCRKLTLM